ncbi:hypothetical protein K9N68_18625 [Kovacikia minuta CCNUW1]|uniref:hypothetical protein n=1 Tax=Kovacikia minuta TaxID=2931930 RepID=UPI001CCA58B6|nr:hypothetical protein [Kovacikia minuta]UBF23777.1 hypothetical protein K9N68_18625 [Kovacikia minuta CCNUW1]
MSEEQPPGGGDSSPKISPTERGIGLALAVAVLLTFIVLVLNPRSMDGGTMAIVRFLAATFAGIAGYLFSGNLGLEAKIPWSKTQIRATGAFAAFVLVLFLFFVGVPGLDDTDKSKHGTDSSGTEQSRSPISVQYWIGFNGYPTLTLSFLNQKFDSEVISQILSEVFATDKRPIIHSENPVFKNIEKFIRESRNQDTLIRVNKENEQLTYYSNNPKVLKKKDDGNSGKKLNINNNDGSIKRSRSNLIPADRIVYESETDNFHFASLLMPFQAANEEAKYTSLVIDKYVETGSEYRIVQFPKLSSFNKLAILDDWSGEDVNTSNNIWIKRLIEGNPSSRGFFAFVYYLKKSLTVNQEKGCGSDPIPESWVWRYMPSPYVMFLDIENKNSSVIQIGSVDIGLLEKSSYELTPTDRRSSLASIYSKQTQAFDMPLQPNQHLFIPIEFGFDTESQRKAFEEFENIPQSSSKEGIETVDDVTSTEIYIGKPLSKQKYIESGCDKDGLSGSHKCIETSSQKVSLRKDFISKLESLEEVLNRVPKRFAVGSILSVSSIEIDGRKIDIRPPKDEANLSIPFKRTAIRGLSCPHLLVFSPYQERWFYLGTVITGRNSKYLKSYDHRNLDIKASKIRLEEREKEVSYIDSIAIEFTDPKTQSPRKVSPPIPELLYVDEKYLTLNQGDSFEINLGNMVPPGATNLKFEINGYYETL